MEEFIYSNHYLDWTLFTLGWVSLAIGLLTIVAFKFTIAVVLLAALVWYVIGHFFGTDYNPFFLPILLAFAAIASFIPAITLLSKPAQRNTIASLCAYFSVYCGLYTVNDWAYAQQQQENRQAVITATKQQEILFKKEFETKQLCRNLDITKFKAEGGDPALIDTCEKLKQSQKQNKTRK